MKARTIGQKRRRKKAIPVSDLNVSYHHNTHDQYADASAWKQSVEARAERLQVLPSVAIRPEYGHTLGLFLIYQERHGVIDEETVRDCLDAGAHFGRVVSAYSKEVLGAPNPNPPGMDMNRIGGKSCNEPTPDEIRQISNSFMALVSCLDRTGPRNEKMRVLRELIICDAEWANWPDRMLRDALAGLKAISAMLKGAK